MNMGYMHEHCHVSEVLRGALDSSSPSSQQSCITRQRGDTHLIGNIHEGSKRSEYYGHGKARLDNSPISSLSPPRSSASSEFPSDSGCEYQYDSDMHKSEISSSSHHATSGNSCVQEPWRAASYSNTVVDSAFEYAKDRADSVGKRMTHTLHELESVLMGSDEDEADMTDVVNENGGTWGELLDLPADQQAGPSLKKLAISEETHQKKDGDLDSLSLYRQPSGSLSSENRVKHLLVTCAAAISEEKLDVAELAMQDLKKIVSVYGSPLERLAAYMSEGLVARLHASGSDIYKALKCSEAPAIEVLSAMAKLFEICPYVKFAYIAANGAIAEAFKNEPMVHIFDFQIEQGMQWFSLIQALANRPGGAPHIRISTVDDPTFQSYPLNGMHTVKKRLSKLAGSLGVPFEFTTISTNLSNLQAHMIERRPGEVLAMNFALQLHHMPDESVCLDNPRDRILRMAKSLNPKVLTLIEQDSNTNTAPFFSRFMETLDYYSAVFESIDVALPRDSKDRVHVEEHCLARDIVNVIACEGVERVERHELAGKWRARMLMAGFKSRSLSSYVNDTIKSLLESYDEKYKLKEDGMALLLGWLNRSLIAASAWH